MPLTIGKTISSWTKLYMHQLAGTSNQLSCPFAHDECCVTVASPGYTQLNHNKLCASAASPRCAHFVVDEYCTYPDFCECTQIVHDELCMGVFWVPGAQQTLGAHPFVHDECVQSMLVDRRPTDTQHTTIRLRQSVWRIIFVHMEYANFVHDKLYVGPR